MAPLFADMWGMHDVGTGWWIVMMLVMILFWAAVIAGVVWLVRGGQGFAGGRGGESPGEVLKRRLAEGSLSPEEYEERRRLLSDDPPRAPRGATGDSSGS